MLGEGGEGRAAERRGSEFWGRHRLLWSAPCQPMNQWRERGTQRLMLGGGGRRRRGTEGRIEAHGGGEGLGGGGGGSRQNGAG